MFYGNGLAASFYIVTEKLVWGRETHPSAYETICGNTRDLKGWLKNLQAHVEIFGWEKLDKLPRRVG